MIDLNNISSIVTLLAALSVASERLVEIIKGVVPWLNNKKSDSNAEGRRQATLQFLAVIAGIITTFLASTTKAVGDVTTHDPFALVVIGLLASGGSGFWNSIQSYMNKAKEVKPADATGNTSGAQV